MEAVHPGMEDLTCSPTEELLGDRYSVMETTYGRPDSNSKLYDAWQYCRDKLQNREFFVACYTDKLLNFGEVNTSRVEGSHAAMKKRVRTAAGDLLNATAAISRYLKARKSHEEHPAPCTGTFRTVHGLPCEHELATYLAISTSIPVSAVHRHWYLYPPALLIRAARKVSAFHPQWIGEILLEPSDNQSQSLPDLLSAPYNGNDHSTIETSPSNPLPNNGDDDVGMMLDRLGGRRDLLEDSISEDEEIDVIVNRMMQREENAVGEPIIGTDSRRGAKAKESRGKVVCERSGGFRNGRRVRSQTAGRQRSADPASRAPSQ